ncbi:hypothetical protein RQP46_007436 [Phenoliferia psychrophenolica]
MPSYYGIYGLYYIYKDAHVPVSLLDVSATASLKDLSAQVRLKQRYQLPTTAPHAFDASYTFPIPARAAVSSFVLIKADGSRVVGVVQEKAEAKATYDAAVQSGKLASLMVQDSPDVFTVSVGNILPGEIVTIELEYATELTEDEENDSIRFHLPATIGARYGSSPVAPAAPSSASTTSTFFTFTASIESLSPIAKIGCPSHSIETSLGPDPSLPNAASLAFSNYAQVNFASPKDLSSDIILTVKSAGLDAPRCIAEIHPTDGTVALATTTVPRFKLPDVARQEFVFLVDRSGSMGTGRMETAKKALVVLLRSLPAVGTEFNVLSFGSQCTPLWTSSRQYNQATLDEATKHVDSMHANFGGTEIRAALEVAFRARKTDRPTSLFVLTDGDAWDLDAVLESVKSAVASAPAGAYLRTFTLGIGESASTAMVEGIARVGAGASTFVRDGESITGKAARLLAAARSPLITNVRLDWSGGASSVVVEKDVDDGFEMLSDDGSERTVAQTDKAPISLFDMDVNPLAEAHAPPPPPSPITLPPTPPAQQSPHSIKGLSPAIRLYVYTILASPLFTGDTSSVPKTVTLRGELFSGDQVALEIPVTLSQIPGSTAIHTLSARKLIQDLDDGQHDLAAGGADPYTVAEMVKASIVRLGTKYSLASKHTSFVAVDESERQGARSRKCDVDVAIVHSARIPIGGNCRSGGPLFGMAQPSAYSARSYSTAAPTPSSFVAVPGSAGVSQSQSRFEVNCRSSSGSGAFAPRTSSIVIRAKGLGTFSSNRDRERSSAHPSPPAAPAANQYQTPGFGSSSASWRGVRKCKKAATLNDDEQVLDDSDDDEHDEMRPRDSPPAFPSLPSADRLDSLTRLQNFDGSFSTNVISLLGADLVKLLAALALGVLAKEQQDKLAATLVAMRYLEKELKDSKDAWEGLWQKAKMFCEGVLGGEGEFEAAHGRIVPAFA